MRLQAGQTAQSGGDFTLPDKHVDCGGIGHWRVGCLAYIRKICSPLDHAEWCSECWIADYVEGEVVEQGKGVDERIP